MKINPFRAVTYSLAFTLVFTVFWLMCYGIYITIVSGKWLMPVLIITVPIGFILLSSIIGEWPRWTDEWDEKHGNINIENEGDDTNDLYEE